MSHGCPPLSHLRLQSLLKQAKIGFRVTENLVHGWDLARSCGAEVQLPETLAERCLDFWLPLAGSDILTGNFGSKVMPPDGASAGVRLLSLLGRAA